MRVNKSELPPKRKSQTWRTVILSLWLVAGLAAETKTIVFFGDSLTAGFGVDPDEAYPSSSRKSTGPACRGNQSTPD
jgi:acyl-CoA thioesterase-1